MTSRERARVPLDIEKRARLAKTSGKHFPAETDIFGTDTKEVCRVPGLGNVAEVRAKRWIMLPEPSKTLEYIETVKDFTYMCRKSGQFKTRSWWSYSERSFQRRQSVCPSS